MRAFSCILSNSLAARCAIAPAIAAGLAACSGGGEDPPTGPQQTVVASVRVTSPAASLEIGATTQLTATALDGNGNVLANRSVSWSSSSDAVLTVSTDGLARGVSPGTARATATIGGKSGSAELSVVPRPAIGLAPSSVSFSATAGEPSPPAQEVAVTNAGGGTLAGLSASVSYPAGQPTGWLSPTLSAAAAPATLALAAATTPLAAGTYGATVAIASSVAGVEARSIAVALSVAAARAVPVASVTVEPGTASVQVGATTQLTATTRAADQSVLTGRPVSWTTSAQAVASVSQSGVVTGVSAGTATITATSEGKSGTAQVTVTTPAPQIAGGSIVYIKGGNVWLSDPSGTIRRPVTTDGRYRSPSMADDGTIGVLRDPETNTAVGTEFVRLSPTGTVLGKFAWTFSNTVHRAAISPDGLSFAHVYTSVCAYRTGGTRTCLRLAFTPSDHYEEVERTGTFDSWDYVWAAWQTNARLVITGGYLASPVLAYYAAEIYVRPTGVVVAEAERDPYRLEDRDYKIYLAALTRDGQRVVTYRQPFRLDGSTEVLGPHEVAIYRHTGPGQYAPEGSIRTTGEPNAVTVSPDGKAWAFADGDGLQVHVFGTTTVRLLDPDGRQPSWGAYAVK